MRFCLTIFFNAVMLLLLSACSTPQQPFSNGPEMPAVKPEPVTRQITWLQADHMVDMCYAQIQRSIGETRGQRGVIWADCMNRHTRPIEQALLPIKADDITLMYENLRRDMVRYYSGQTTYAALQQKWEQQQRAIGYPAIRTFRDTPSAVL